MLFEGIIVSLQRGRKIVMEEERTFTAQEPMMARPMTTYADVMYYLHTIRISPEDKRKVANRLNLEVTGKNLSRIFERLDYLSSLQADWDGYGALPIARKVIENLKNVLLVSDDKDWENWVVGAEPNATLMLQSKTNRVSISLGNDEFSYYALVDGKRFGESHVDFEPNRFLNIMRLLDK